MTYDYKYIDKLDEYQRLGISEYWIVDYLALGSRNYLGNPKVPTVFVYLLDDSRSLSVYSLPRWQSHCFTNFSGTGINC